MKLLDLSNKNLESFNAKEYCQENSIDPLSIEWLELNNNKISSIKNFDELKKLKILYLNNNEIPKTEIEDLKEALLNTTIHY